MEGFKAWPALSSNLEHSSAGPAFGSVGWGEPTPWASGCCSMGLSKGILVTFSFCLPAAFELTSCLRWACALCRLWVKRDWG